VRQRIRYYLQLVLAWLLLIVGAVLFISPLSVGIFFIAAGLALLIYTNEFFQFRVHDCRKRYSEFSLKLEWVEGKLDNRVSFISEALRKTRPALPKDN